MIKEVLEDISLSRASCIKASVCTSTDDVASCLQAFKRSHRKPVKGSTLLLVFYLVFKLLRYLGFPSIFKRASSPISSLYHPVRL
jgi:hypothetical protein